MPSVALFLLRFFLLVLLLFPSVFSFVFLSEALEFPAGDFCVLPVTALRISTLFFQIYTWYVHCSCLFLVAFVFVGLFLVCLGKLLATVCVNVGVFWFLGFC